MESLDDFTGLICYHEKTGGIMIIKKATLFNDKLEFACKVFVKEENGDEYLADATYSNDEVLVTKRKYTDLLIEHQLKKGTQLSLFN